MIQNSILMHFVHVPVHFIQKKDGGALTSRNGKGDQRAAFEQTHPASGRRRAVLFVPVRLSLAFRAATPPEPPVSPRPEPSPPFRKPTPLPRKHNLQRSTPPLATAITLLTSLRIPLTASINLI